jgi:hypothetical protein
MTRLSQLLLSLPLFVRQFLLFTVVTFFGLVVALNLAIPGSLSEARAQALLVVTSLVTAAAMSFVRVLPQLYLYVAGLLGLTIDGEPVGGYAPFADGAELGDLSGAFEPDYTMDDLDDEDDDFPF